MSTAVTENKFSDLKAKLRELFELDKSDLDFGIYRIMAAKNKEVNEFLDRQLKDVVRQTLAAHGAGAAAQIEAEMEKARSAARTAGFDPEESPTVRALKVRLVGTGGASAAELEADIYNHLLAFFSRYYDEGDFISKRRYKGDVYAIPYGGEEVTLYWANKDQYYVKSGEWHKDYRFKVGGKAVHFKLVEATQETNNNKEPDDAKRRYILASDRPIEANGPELTMSFEFRVPTEAEKQAIPESTRIFGGKYAAASGRTKGDEREQFCADAEQSALAAMPEAWKPIVTALAPTEAKPARTILGKHLEDFTARNTFDYFIHKDLGGFLRRELDFYIKNEVVRLDDLEALPADHLARVQNKVKAIRAVAGRVIDFLASVENFQKKMWLKKKLVLDTNWLVTVDRIPANLRDIVAANEDQWMEWESLGFKPGDGDPTLLNGPRWRSREYLEGNDNLVVDSRFFSRDFTRRMLAEQEVLSGKDSIDNAIAGLLVSGDNFQALGLIGPTYYARIKCVYIDPPYNAPNSEIAYKNNFKHSSFLSLIDSRLSRSASLSTADGSHVVAIDKNEGVGVQRIMKDRFGGFDVVAVTIEHNRKGVQDAHFSFTHELAIFAMPSELKSLNQTDRPEADWEYSNFRNWGGESLRTDAANCFYPVFAKDDRIVGFGPVCDGSYHPRSANVIRENGIMEIYPIDGQLAERKWRYERGTVEGIRHLLKLEKTSDGVTHVKIAKAQDQFKTVWYSPRYNAGDHGTKAARNLGLPLGDFDYPKSIYTVRDCIFAVSGPSDITADYFAGSGTTGHAVIALNREDRGGRRFILVEMGAYFHTVLKPRITKVLYSPEWKDGKAQVHGKGTSALVKYFTLESYEDALNNLPAPTGELLASADPATKDGLITYSLDIEMGPNLLNPDVFRDPWGYTINAQPAGEAEIGKHPVDLVETFNYLLGLKVNAYGPLERYTADFERAEHADNLGRLKVTGPLRLDRDGPFVFQRVEGELLDGRRILVVWRKLTDNAEQNAAALEAWMVRHREETKERSEYRDYHQIYINGPVTLLQPTAEIRTVLPIEQTFKDRMFEDADGGQG